MWIKKFTVEGSLGFPIDMLRYDGCYPASSDDVSAIHQSIAQTSRHDEVPDTVQVSLVVSCTTRGQTEMYPTAPRWESFGWRVVREDSPFRL